VLALGREQTCFALNLPHGSQSIRKRRMRLAVPDVDPNSRSSVLTELGCQQGHD
jgi:hypothetical protein